RHADERFLRRLDALLDRRRHFLRLADAEAHHAVAVADDDQRAEAEVLAALDHLRDAADVDDRVLQVELRRVDFFASFKHCQFPVSCYQLSASGFPLPASSSKACSTCAGS